jgi:MinD-like ATPase involved in chromosome partitioning or flagellar assembly
MTGSPRGPTIGRSAHLNQWTKLGRPFRSCNVQGTVITFYSYKGGVGRSFALANIAVLLAEWKYKVLMIDWDIEAPGLANYFSDWTKSQTTGLIKLLGDCQKGSVKSWENYTIPIEIPGCETLALMPAGSQTAAYIRNVQRINWSNLYSHYNFGDILNRLRNEWASNFDFILLDARTGITDFSGIITAQLPDVLAFLFTANHQSLDGACNVVDRAAAARQKLPYDRSAFYALPIVGRFETSEEYEQSKKWRDIFAEKLGRFLKPWSSRGIEPRRLIEHLTIPYFPYWSFGEELAVLKEPPGSPQIREAGMISFAFETIAALLAHRLGRTELLESSRDDFVHSARRAGGRRRQRDYDLFLSFTKKNTAIADDMANWLQKFQFDIFKESGGLAERDRWRVALDEALNRARNLVVILDEGRDKRQMEEVNTFVRQTIDDKRRRVVIPVFVSRRAQNQSWPTVINSLQSVNLDDGREETWSKVGELLRTMAEK